MTIIATKDPVFSEFLVDTLDPTIMNFGVRTVNVNLASAATINWGDVLYYAGSNNWRQLVAADFTSNELTDVTSDLPNGTPICIVVGDASGLGRGYATSVAATTDTNFTVLFRGPAKFKQDKLAYGDTLSAPQMANAKINLEQRNIEMVDVGAVVSTTFHV